MPYVAYGNRSKSCTFSKINKDSVGPELNQLSLLTQIEEKYLGQALIDLNKYNFLYISQFSGDSLLFPRC